MANTAEMLRLMRHAADLLDEQDPVLNANAVAYYSSARDEVQKATRRAHAQAVANGVAAATLRMVAAAMDDEPKTETPEPKRGPDGRFQKAITAQPEETPVD